jgi:hypothetical protein
MTTMPTCVVLLVGGVTMELLLLVVFRWKPGPGLLNKWWRGLGSTLSQETLSSRLFGHFLLNSSSGLSNCSLWLCGGSIGWWSGKVAPLPGRVCVGGAPAPRLFRRVPWLGWCPMGVRWWLRLVQGRGRAFLGSRGGMTCGVHILRQGCEASMNVVNLHGGRRKAPCVASMVSLCWGVRGASLAVFCTYRWLSCWLCVVMWLCVILHWCCNKFFSYINANM